MDYLVKGLLFIGIISAGFFSWYLVLSSFQVAYNRHKEIAPSERSSSEKKVNKKEIEIFLSWGSSLNLTVEKEGGEIKEGKNNDHQKISISWESQE